MIGRCVHMYMCAFESGWLIGDLRYYLKAYTEFKVFVVNTLRGAVLTNLHLIGSKTFFVLTTCKFVVLFVVPNIYLKISFFLFEILNIPCRCVPKLLMRLD